jgi:hypothetical protein
MHTGKDVDAALHPKPFLNVQFAKTVFLSRQKPLKRTASQVVVQIDDVVETLCLKCRHQLFSAFVDQMYALDERMGLDDLIMLNLSEVVDFGIGVMIGNCPDDRCGQHHVTQRAKADDQNLQRTRFQ